MLVTAASYFLADLATTPERWGRTTAEHSCRLQTQPQSDQQIGVDDPELHAFFAKHARIFDAFQRQKKYRTIYMGQLYFSQVAQAVY